MGIGSQTELYFSNVLTVGSVVNYDPVETLSITSKQVKICKTYQNLQTKINLVAYFINIINMNIITTDKLNQYNCV